MRGAARLTDRHAQADRFEHAAPRRAVRARLGRWLHSRFQLAPPLTIVIGAPPDVCWATLAAATRPSQSRLHLRDVFAEGRRYYLAHTAEGFRITSDTRRFWSGRRSRTQVAAVVFGSLDSGSGRKAGPSQPAETARQPITFVRLHVQGYTLHLIRTLALPVFVCTLVLASSWPDLVRALVMTVLLVLGWAMHRFEAMMQADSIYAFVQKALEDLPHAEIRGLPTAGAHIILDPDFRSAWERYYGDRAPGEDPPPTAGTPG
jgi:hypothetical protein